METPAISFPAVAPLGDDEIRNPPEQALNDRLRSLHGNLKSAVALAVTAGMNSLCYAIAIGQIFHEAFRRHEGSFAAWLAFAVGEDAEGRPALSEQTARRWRTLWLKRDLIFPADGSQPTCRNLQEAYIKVGIMPAPQPIENATSTAPAFRLTWSTPAADIATWSPADRTAYLTKAEPIGRLYEQAKAIAAEAA